MFFVPSVFTQTGVENPKELAELTQQISILKKSLRNIEKSNSDSLVSLNRELQLQKQVNIQVRNKLDSTEASLKKLHADFARSKTIIMDEKSHTKTTFQKYSYIALALLLFIAGLVFGYFLINRKTTSLSRKANELDEDAQNIKNNVKELLENNSENLLNLINEFKQLKASHQSANDTVDHTMALEFVKQIITMENNMFHMNPNDPGLRRIRRAMDKMYDTLISMDYEVTRLIGANLMEGQTIEIDRMESDESALPGQKTVINIIKAEVFYKQKLTQRGKVDIKYNPN